jgi:PAS domain S-box-containing protein
MKGEDTVTTTVREPGSSTWQSFGVAAVLLILGALLHIVAQVGSHLEYIGDPLQETLIIMSLILLFAPVVYAMRDSLSHKPVRYLLILGLTAKAGHLFLDTAEELPALATYGLLQKFNSVHVVLQETLSSAATALLVSGLFCFVVLHRAAEKQLRQEGAALRREMHASRRLATAIDHATEAVVVTDNSGTIQYVNPAFERISQYQQEEVIGKNFMDRLHNENHADAFYSDMWASVREGRDWIGTFIDRKKDGSLYRTQTTISPVRDASGNIINFVSVQLDLSREIALQEQVRHAQKMEAVGSLASGIAHNLRTMLSSLLGWIEIAMDARDDADLLSQSLHSAEAIGNRATQQIGDLLAFSRRSEPDLRPVNLSDEISAATDLLRGGIPATIRFEMALDRDTSTFMGDARQVMEMTVNLIVNAAQAIGDRGMIKVTVGSQSDRPDMVVLRIEDDGPGMSESTRSRVFEPFFTTKGPGEGTGLGLSVVHSIVTSHNGTIEVESEVGKGTQVTVLFPTLTG